MAQTTFSGPIKAGTIRQGTGENLGFTLMAQSAVIDIIGATNTSTIGIIPANSQIVDVILNVTTVANDSGTATVQVGHAGDTDEYLPATNVKALATTRGTIQTDGTDIGTFTLDGQQEAFIRKDPTDKLFAANANVEAVSVAVYG